MNTKKPELLSPAGDLKSLKAAVNAGADSIYIGGKMYSARASASNFDLDEIKEALDYCLLRGVKLFVTVNTLYKQNEIGEVVKFIAKLYEMGVTALIVQDIGLSRIIKESFPDIKLHASTQMTAHSLDDVKFLERLSFDRIVLSRELSLAEIKEIKENTNVQIETFIHGALCISYSGACLMSSMIGGRSGNRGRCAQPCRRRYELECDGARIENKDKYILSLKDICTVDIVGELIEAGIDSFKIEGRMKKPEYVAGVTAVYRKYIDSAPSPLTPPPHQGRGTKAPLPKWERGWGEGTDKQTLAQLFNRGNFSEGYYHTTKSKDMMSMKSPKNQGVLIGEIIGYEAKNKDCIIKAKLDLAKGDGIVISTRNGDEVNRTLAQPVLANTTFKQYLEDKVDIGSKVYRIYDAKLENDLKAFYEKDTKKHKINMKAELRRNEQLKLTIYDKENIVSVNGDIVEVATNNPTSEEKIKEQLSKIGNTPFEIEDISIESHLNIYINISKINEARRTAIALFTEKILSTYRREAQKYISDNISEVKRFECEKKITVLVKNLTQFLAAIESQAARIYVDIFEFNDDMESMIENAHEKGIQVFVALPYILRSKNKEKVYKKIFKKLENTDIDGYLVRTYSEYDIIKASKKKKVIDYTLNLYNNNAISFWLNQGIENITISPELNVTEIAELTEGQEIIVYGKLPVMFIEQCIVKNLKGDIACSEKGKKYYLKDELNINFELERECNLCLNVLYNSENIYALANANKISKLGVKYYRVNLKDEDYETTKNILRIHKEALVNRGKSKEISEHVEKMKNIGYTRGHYFRGVE